MPRGQPHLQDSRWWAQSCSAAQPAAPGSVAKPLSVVEDSRGSVESLPLQGTPAMLQQLPAALAGSAAIGGSAKEPEPPATGGQQQSPSNIHCLYTTFARLHPSVSHRDSRVPQPQGLGLTEEGMIFAVVASGDHPLLSTQNLSMQGSWYHSPFHRQLPPAPWMAEASREQWLTRAQLPGAASPPDGK